MTDETEWEDVKPKTWAEASSSGYGYCFPFFGSLFLRASANCHDIKKVAAELRERYESWQNT